MLNSSVVSLGENDVKFEEALQSFNISMTSHVETLEKNITSLNDKMDKGFMDVANNFSFYFPIGSENTTSEYTFSFICSKYFQLGVAHHKIKV